MNGDKLSDGVFIPLMADNIWNLGLLITVSAMFTGICYGAKL